VSVEHGLPDYAAVYDRSTEAPNTPSSGTARVTLCSKQCGLIKYTQAMLACKRAPTASKPFTGHQATVDAAPAPSCTSASSSALSEACQGCIIHRFTERHNAVHTTYSSRL